MLKPQHSEIRLIIKPVGEDQYEETHLLKNIILNIDSADEYIGWGGERNDIVSDAKYRSKFNLLENWWIESCENLSDSDLGIRWALENSNRLDEKRNKKFNIDAKNLGNHGWLNPNGEFFKVDGFHIDWAESHIWKNNLNKKYRNWMFADMMHNDSISKTHSTSDFLEHIGWIRIQGSRNKNHTPYVESAWFSKINDKQLLTLIRMCKKYNSDLTTVIECSDWYDYNGRRRNDKFKARFSNQYL